MKKLSSALKRAKSGKGASDKVSATAFSRGRSNEFCDCRRCGHVTRMRNHLVTFEAYQLR